MNIITSILLAAAAYLCVNSGYILYRSMNISLKNLLMCSKECTAAACIAAVSLASFSIYQGNLLGAYDYIRCIFIITLMALLSVIDYEEKKVPNRILVIILLVWILLSSIFIFIDLQLTVYKIITALFGAVFALITFGITYIVSKKMLGAGDVKLSFLMGLYLGAERIFGAVLYGALLSVFFSLGGLLAKKLKRSDNIPFVPFLFIGSVITLFVKI